MEVKKGCQLLYGIFDATISRNDGWHFGKIGQLIESAIHVKIISFRHSSAGQAPSLLDMPSRR